MIKEVRNSELPLIYTPQLMTELCQKAVPVLAHCEWEILKVAPGYSETMLPLNHATTNQHGTHQAALISLSADYTGGMALTTIFQGEPLAGIHKVGEGDSASLWLVGMNMRYHKPSTGHLIGTCTIEPGKYEMLCRRYQQGKKILVSLDIEFHSNDELVATGDLKYYAQKSSSLKKNSKSGISSLAEQKLKASARMIAGIRAMAANSRFKITSTSAELNDKVWRVDHGQLDQVAAGPHGMILAEKMRQKLPQLVTFVQARTQHVDQLISQTADLEQLVFVGAGLDMRALSHAQMRPELMAFELDLPEMLVERDRVKNQMAPTVDNSIGIPCDFTRDDIAELLIGNGFKPDAKSIFVFEGCSMYFSEDINGRILNSIKSLMQNEESTLWLDLVSKDVIQGESNNADVEAFLVAMKELGERFVFGSNDCRGWLSELGFRVMESVSTKDFLKVKEKSVLDHYQFNIVCNPMFHPRKQTLS